MEGHYSHSGDLGDIIYSLPTIRAAGGGTLHLYDHPGRTAHGMNKRKAESLRKLLILQPYIKDVVFDPFAPQDNLNGFRDHGGAGNLADMHLSTYGLGWEHRSTKWLTVDKAESPYEVIIAKTQRYPNMQFNWYRILDKYQGRVGYVGFESEHKWLCDALGRDIPFVEANDLLEVARVIAGCKLFIGNSTCATAIAEGLKKNMIVEVCPSFTTPCDFRRLGCLLAVDGKVELPDLDDLP